MRFDTAIFDLDGTLLDSLADIAAAGNAAMRAVGRPTHPLDAYRRFAGQGRAYLIEHALGPDHQHLADEAIAAHRRAYAENLGALCRPFPGVLDLLDTLAARGVTLGVLTNKVHEHALEEINQQLGLDRFASVLGQREGVPVKPDPTGAFEMIEALGTTPDRVVYVGDTAADMQTGQAAGFFTVGVTWGFRGKEELIRTGADTLIDRPAQLLDAIDSSSNANQSA